MARPVIRLPDWFVENSTRKVEPSDAKRAQGWSINEPLPAQILNWLLQSISEWLAYVANDVAPFVGVASQGGVETDSAFTLTAADDGKIFFLDSSHGGFDIDLCDPALFANKKFTLKDETQSLNEFPCFLRRFAAEKIENFAADYELASNGGQWDVFSNGTDWFFIGG